MSFSFTDSESIWNNNEYSSFHFNTAGHKKACTSVKSPFLSDCQVYSDEAECLTLWNLSGSLFYDNNVTFNPELRKLSVHTFQPM